MTASTAPAVLAALYALGQTVGASFVEAQQEPYPGFSLNVMCGPQNSDGDNYLIFGWTGREGEAAIEAVYSSSGDIRPRNDRESYDVHSVLSIWLGEDDDNAGTDNLEVLALAYQLLDAIDDATTADVRLGLGSLLVSARLTGSSLEPDIGRGAAASLSFTHHIEAYRRQPA